MLHKLYSDLPTFKTVNFHPGLNIILAEKTKNSSDKKSRNGAGKSSFVELINALLGSDLKKGNVLKANELLHYNFGLELSIANSSFTIERSGDRPTKLFVKNCPDNILNLSYMNNGDRYFPIDSWREFLGKNIFGIFENIKGVQNGPSFRSLQSYFSRSTKGFDSPDKIHPRQTTCNSQVSVSYLLHLNWKISTEFELIRQNEKLIKALKQAANEGSLGLIMGSASDLRTEIHLKNAKFESLKKTLSEFRILATYEEKEARLGLITRELSNLSAEDTTDKEWLSQLEKALEDETAPAHEKIDKLFFEASFELPELVKRRFEEVAAFHDSIVSNRRDHLKREVEEIKLRIKDRLNKKSTLDDERSEIFVLLQSYGALEQYTSMQNELSRIEAQLELLRKKLEATDNLDYKKTELKISRQNLLKDMRIDYTERNKSIKDAIITFGQISKELYDESGKLIIEPTKNGPEFEFDIPGKKSTGKQKMQIFCFDMTLMKLWSNEKNRPDVLIHDSILFDGVDERQIASALMIGDKMSKQYGFQYIVTINSDDFAKAKNFSGFNLDGNKIALEINDTPNGGLFGMRFTG